MFGLTKEIDPCRRRVEGAAQEGKLGLARGRWVFQDAFGQTLTLKDEVRAVNYRRLPF